MQPTQHPARRHPDRETSPLIPTASFPQALRILSHSCDSEIDNPDTPLALWDTLEKEVHHGYIPLNRVANYGTVAETRVDRCTVPHDAENTLAAEPSALAL